MSDVSTLISDIRDLDIMPSRGVDCIKYNDKYYKLGPGYLVHDGAVIQSVDDLDDGLYTFILFVDSSFKKRPFTRSFTRKVVVGKHESILNELELVRNLVNACCQNEKSACERILPYLRIGVARCHTLWEEGTKHSSIVLGYMQKEDFIVSAGEMKKEGNVAYVNAFSGTYALPVLEQIALSARLDRSAKSRMMAANSKYLNCTVSLLDVLSKKTKIEPVSEVLITEENTEPYVKSRIQDFYDNNRPIYRYDSIDECNKNVERARIGIRTKIRQMERQRALLLRMKRNVDTVDAAIIELRNELNNLEEQVWNGEW